MATTVIWAFTRAFVAVASVISVLAPEMAAQTGSCPGASPNHTRIRLASGLHPIDASVAICWSAYSCPSGVSLPSLAAQVLTAVVTAVRSVVGASWGWKAYGLDSGTGKSL